MSSADCARGGGGGSREPLCLSLAPTGWAYFLKMADLGGAVEARIPDSLCHPQGMLGRGHLGAFLSLFYISSGFSPQAVASKTSSELWGRRGSDACEVRLSAPGTLQHFWQRLMLDRGAQSSRRALGSAEGPSQLCTEEDVLRAVCKAWKLPGLVFPHCSFIHKPAFEGLVNDITHFALRRPGRAGCASTFGASFGGPDLLTGQLFY